MGSYPLCFSLRSLFILEFTIYSNKREQKQFIYVGKIKKKEYYLTERVGHPTSRVGHDNLFRETRSRRDLERDVGW